MLNMQFDIKRVHGLKDILLHLRRGESVEADFERFCTDISIVEVLLIELELINGDYGIGIEDVQRLSRIHSHLYSTKTYHSDHPVEIFKEENVVLQSTLEKMGHLLEQDADRQEELNELLSQLGEFHKHYHRKEKLFFPIMERYGHFAPTRMMWRRDDYIRSLYKTLKRQIELLPGSDINRVQKTYDLFAKEFQGMVFQEEAMMLPVLENLFQEEDWLAIADESDAFGYALIEVPPKEGCTETVTEMPKQNLPFGGGYLTAEEANLILNSLPLEITFIDKNSVFKYFNKLTDDASEMMLVRTQISIGRNVANCHPPKSLQKVMTLIRDLRTGKRTSESMWFKKGDQYIHLTYKAIFNGEGEYLGILEYVQDIQPFFDLPREVKTGLQKLEE